MGPRRRRMCRSSRLRFAAARPVPAGDVSVEIGFGDLFFFFFVRDAFLAHVDGNLFRFFARVVDCALDSLGKLFFLCHQDSFVFFDGHNTLPERALLFWRSLSVLNSKGLWMIIRPQVPRRNSGRVGSRTVACTRHTEIEASTRVDSNTCKHCLW